MEVKFTYVIDQMNGNKGGWIYRQVGNRAKVQWGYIYQTANLKTTVRLLNQAANQ